MAMPNDKGFLYYENLLKQKPQEFLALLDRNLVDGGAEGEKARIQLDVIALDSKVAELLFNHRNDDGDTVAHTAATFHQKPNLLLRILNLSPDLLMEERKEDFTGQTPLHIIIAKGSRKMAKAILEHPHCQENRERILRAKAVGSKFKNTVMMGQLPLSVAALTLKKNMVKLLIEHGANIGWRNEKKDTVFHSLIRFANVHSDKINGLLDMMIFINTKLPPNQRDIWHTAKNRDKLTPLKLAASLGLVDIFSAILNLDGVYRSLNAHDGLFDIHLYDVTEIDTVTQAEWERYNGSLRIVDSKQEAYKACCPLISKKTRSWKDAQHRPALRHKAPAVLDIICRLPVRQAFDFIYVEAVNELITLKWDYYKWFFKLWAIYHLLIMIHITTFAIYKTKFINSVIYPQQNVTKTERNFVNATGAFTLAYACIYLFFELLRSAYFRQAWYIRLIQHNGLYRLMLVVFSSALVIDTIWFYSHPRNNYFLILAIILGWTFMAFFLRTWKRFSFYTVMFQKVLLGDMTRLSVIILFQLIAFSVAIYTIFLNTQPTPSEFNNAGLAMMTMFKLMLGLTDIEVLSDAREPWLAISLYVVFVLVTYVLLINSLIAMMSRTCDLISEDRNRQWELQRLSVILLLETMLLPRWRYMHKAGIKAIRRYGLRSHEYRCYIEITSIQTTYRDGKAVLQRKSMINTIGFSQDGGMSLLAPIFRSVGPHNRGTQHGTGMNFNGTGLKRTIKEESWEDKDDEEEEEDEENAGILLEEHDENSESEDDDDDRETSKVWDQYYSNIGFGQKSSSADQKNMEEYFNYMNQAALPHSISRQHNLGESTSANETALRTPSMNRKKLRKAFIAGAMFQVRPRRHMRISQEQQDSTDRGLNREDKSDQERDRQMKISTIQDSKSTNDAVTIGDTFMEPSFYSTEQVQLRRNEFFTSSAISEHEFSRGFTQNEQLVPEQLYQNMQNPQLQPQHKQQVLKKSSPDKFQVIRKVINPVKIDEPITKSVIQKLQTKQRLVQQQSELFLVPEPLQVESIVKDVNIDGERGSQATGLKSQDEGNQAGNPDSTPKIQHIEIAFLDSYA